MRYLQTEKSSPVYNIRMNSELRCSPNPVFGVTVILKVLSPFPTPATQQTIHKLLPGAKYFTGEK